MKRAIAAVSERVIAVANFDWNSMNVSFTRVEEKEHMRKFTPNGPQSTKYISKLTPD